MADMDSSLSSHQYHPYPLMQNHPFQHDFKYLPSSQNLHYNHGSVSGWMDQVDIRNIIPGRRLEDLDHAMGGLTLELGNNNNPFGNTYSVAQFSSPNLDSAGTNNFFNIYDDDDDDDEDAGYEYQSQSQLLLQRRINAAATALRVRDICGHSDPISSNLINNNYRFRMERSIPLPQVQVQQQRRHDFNSIFGDVRGKVVSKAKEQCGCRMLQFMIDWGMAEHIDIIISEVKDHVHDLMTHHFGNYVIQKIFQARRVSLDQMNRIFFQVIHNVPKLKDVCMNNYGTRAVQRMLENLKTPTQICEIIGVLYQITVPLMKNVNGGYVIQQCIKLYPSMCQKVILNQMARNCIDIAIDKSGCSIIQRCMAHAEGETMIPLIEAIITNAAVLAEDEYGNYVMKFLIETMKILPVNAKIILELRGKYVQLSMNKYASNVVQHLLKHSEDKAAAIIVLEIMGSREFLNVLQDPFGNYVSQTAIDFTEGPLLKRLLNAVFSYQRSLASHPYGKRVLDCAKDRKTRSY